MTVDENRKCAFKIVNKRDATICCKWMDL